MIIFLVYVHISVCFIIKFIKINIFSFKSIFFNSLYTLTYKNIHGVKSMCSEHVTIMIKGSVNDMFGEFCYFLTEIFPELNRLCKAHDIDIDYVDSFYSISKEDKENNRLILANLNSIDLDRTFFICFRGQRLGWVPSEDDVDKLTLEVYPELVNYIGAVSITELSIMHALKPFEKYESGELISLPSVKHALFYFRNPNYLENLDDYQKLFYTNSPMGEDAEVPDLNVAKAKDLIYDTKEDLDLQGITDNQITIRHYDGIWDNDLNRNYFINQYMEKYAELKGFSSSMSIDFEHLFDEGAIGCFGDFRCDDKSLKECIIEDVMESLKMEFPDNFN